MKEIVSMKNKKKKKTADFQVFGGHIVVWVVNIIF